MERLAALERSGATEGPIKGAWEDAFLDLTHRLITQPGTEVAWLIDQLRQNESTCDVSTGLHCRVAVLLCIASGSCMLSLCNHGSKVKT